MRQLKISQRITNRETQSLDKYLQEIAKCSLITPEMEVDLAIRIRQGDTVALEKLATANLRFVVSVAKQYQNRGLPLGDLINEGNVGLVRAASRFDETRGFKFISYAVWWIRQAILQALAEQARVVRLPLNRVGMAGKIARAFAELEQKFQRDPSAQELAELTGLSLDDIELNTSTSARAISVDAPIFNDDDGTWLDLLSDKSERSPDFKLDVDSLKTEINNALSTLTIREAEVIVYYFGLRDSHPMTLEEIGVKFNLTRERVRQIKEKATRRLRNVTKSRILRTYLDLG